MTKKFLNQDEEKKFIDSINNLPYQCQQAFKEVQKIKLPSNYLNLKEIIICGMGGSALGTDFLRHIFYFQIKKPIIIINNYFLPYYISTKSLIIISSYSGNTEESISCLKEALNKKSKIIIITTGGKLSILARKNKIPAYIFEPKFNPSQQPRMGLGYSILAQLLILNKLRYINIKKEEIENNLNSFFKDNKNSIKKNAQLIAKKIKGKIPIIIAADFLSGNAHILSNQINENSKNFANYFLLPELNHHLMEGLKFPKLIKEKLIFLFLESNNYSSIIKKRILITKKVLKKNKISFISYSTNNKGNFIEGLEILFWGSWLSFYLSKENRINPSEIPYVDYFKKQLNKI